VRYCLAALAVVLAGVGTAEVQEETPRDDEEAISVFKRRGATLKTDGQGNVTELRFPSGKGTDGDLVHLRGFHHLRKLNFGSSIVCEGELRHLQGLTTLQVLGLYDTATNDEDVSYMAGLSDLRELGLAMNNVSDAGLAHLGGLTKLTKLFLDSNNIGDAGLAHLKDLVNLEVLGLRMSYRRGHKATITDAGLVHLKGLTRLRHLNLMGARVTASGVLQLASLPSLKYLNLRYTLVDGEGEEKLLRALPQVSMPFSYLPKGRRSSYEDYRLADAEAERRRMGRFVAGLREESLSNAVAGLTIYGDYPLHIVSHDSLDPGVSFYAQVVLGSRRYSRFEKLVRDLPVQDRRAAAAAAVNEVMKRRQQTVDRIVRRFIDPDAPKNTQSVTGDLWAACSALFLTARLGEAKLVREEIQQGRAFTAGAAEKVRGEPFPAHLPGFFQRDTRIPLDVEGTALVMAIESFLTDRKTAELEPEAVQAVRDVMTKVMAKLKRREATIVVWDTGVAETDRSHRTFRGLSGLPVTQAGEKVPTYWGFRPEQVDELLRLVSESRLFGQ